MFKQTRIKISTSSYGNKLKDRLSVRKTKSAVARGFSVSFANDIHLAMDADCEHKFKISLPFAKKYIAEQNPKKIDLLESGFSVSVSAPEKDITDPLLENLVLLVCRPSWQEKGAIDNNDFGYVDYKPNYSRARPTSPWTITEPLSCAVGTSIALIDLDIRKETQRRIKAFENYQKYVTSVNFDKTYHKKIKQDIDTRLQFFDMIQKAQELFFSCCYDDDKIKIAQAMKALEEGKEKFIHSIYAEHLVILLTVLHESPTRYYSEDWFFGCEKRDIKSLFKKG